MSNFKTVMSEKLLAAGVVNADGLAMPYIKRVKPNRRSSKARNRAMAELRAKQASEATVE